MCMKRFRSRRPGPRVVYTQTTLASSITMATCYAATQTLDSMTTVFVEVQDGAAGNCDEQCSTRLRMLYVVVPFYVICIAVPGIRHLFVKQS
jgi:hypothetical protein